MSSALQTYEPETNILFHKDIRFHPRLTFGEKMFYAEIESLAQKNEKKVCPFSSRKLSLFFNVSHQTILNWIRNLSELDLLEVGIDFTNNECRHFLKLKGTK